MSSSATSCLRAAEWMSMEELYYEWMGGRMPAQITHGGWGGVLRSSIGRNAENGRHGELVAEPVLRALLPDASRLSVDALRVEQ